MAENQPKTPKDKPPKARSSEAKKPKAPKKVKAVSTWDRLDDPVRSALATAWQLDVPPIASALHARWWQLETWLRQLVYVELRSKFGRDWVAQLPAGAERTLAKDRSTHRYMSTPDASDYLAYLDVGELFPLIGDHWDLFKDALIDRPAWDGRYDELNKIRRRIAHCRRPHDDDLSRLEQLLRDLDAGAFRALSSFNERFRPSRELDDPLVKAWARREHKVADLIDHAELQYDTRFDLSASARPWAAPITEVDQISGNPGYLWHATWRSRNSIQLRKLWEDSYLDIDGWRDLIVYLSADEWSVSVSFSALDDPDLIADAIGFCFQSVLHNMDRWHRVDLSGDLLEDRWRIQQGQLDPRVQVSSGWNIVDSTTVPITIFGA